MEQKFKISLLSVVCVLCAAVTLPGYGAASVRSLGGAGTYVGTSGAAAAKRNGVSNSVNSARAGSMRVNKSDAATSGSRISATRASGTPRLSIGKYLSGSSMINPGQSVSGGVASGRPDDSDDKPSGLEARVDALEAYVDFDADAQENIADKVAGVSDRIERLVLDVDKLSQDLSLVTGEHTVVDYENGVLTVVQDGQTFNYELNKVFAGKDEVAALQDAIDDIQMGKEALINYYTKTEVDGLLEGYAKKGDERVITADMLDVGNVAPGGLLMLQTNAQGVPEWVDVNIY